MPTRSNTISAESQPTHYPYSVPEEKPFDQDVSDPYTIDETLEQPHAKPKITDIYADSVVERESLNRDSLNLEMFTPATDVVNWQAPPNDLGDHGEIFFPLAGGKTTASYAVNKKKTTGDNQPEDMVSLVD